MGSGKTVILLTAIVESTSYEERILVISTKRIAESVWRDEVKVWGHTDFLKVATAVGTPKQRLAALRDETADIVTINVENIAWFLEQDAEESFGFEIVILDELSLWKGTGVRWKKMRKWLAERDRVYGLTGTPAPKGLPDLWAQMELIVPSVLGRSKTRFIKEHFYPEDYNGHKLAVFPGAEEKIYKKLAPYIFRVENNSEDVPEVVFNKVYIDLPDKVMDLMRELRREYLITVDGHEISAPSEAAATGKVHQMANGMVYDDDHTPIYLHSAKRDALVEIVDQLQGQNVIIVYDFLHDLSSIQEALPDVETFEDDTVARWNAGEINKLAMHPATGGHGLNIQKGGHHIIWYGLPWNLDHFEQMIARLARSGQLNDSVFVHVLLARGTIDEVIFDTLTMRGDVQQACLDYFRDMAV